MSVEAQTKTSLQPLSPVEKYRLALYLLGWIIPGLLLLAGLAGALVLLTGGEEAFGTSNAFPWGLLIAGYVLLAVTCSGLCLISSLGHVFGVKRFEVIGERAVFLAITVLLAGFAVLAVELGHPLRLVYVLLSPNLTSGIWWMGTIYGIYFVCLLLELFFMLTNRHRAARSMGSITVVLAVAATTNLGSVFGLLHARPFWYGAYWPIYMLVTAVMSGAAALLILTWSWRRALEGKRRLGFFRNGNMKNYRLGKLARVLSWLLVGLLGFTAVLTVWNIISSLYGGVPARYQAAMALLTGPLAPTFWIFEVGLGLVVPLVLIMLSKGKSDHLNLAAAVSAITGVLFMRYHMVSAGQVVPAELLDPAARFSGYAFYTPSPGEIGVMLGAVGFIILAYRLGERYLPLKP